MRFAAGFALMMGLLSAAPAWSADAPAAEAASGVAAASRPVYVGDAGAAPVQVVYAWLADRIADEHGLFDYQKLDIRQTGKGEDIRQVEMVVQMDGLLDDSVKTQRYQLRLDFVGAQWQIVSARQDWTCRRGGKGWTQRPCK
ncbi:hypothetical protein [Chitinilyticum aquatile]|uniref:hypothetical protein n=1 Tax=Chitinilyticum aquatile TaxID=362520 RepID=UPI0004048D7B|nr:hypothetical protein [Chitinilyticum aquatile]